MNAQNLQSSVEGSGQLQLLVYDSYNQVNAHRNPDLRFHSIRAGSVEMFDPQVSLDPSEEQFDMRAWLAETSHGVGGPWVGAF
jgi:hypothetical protein